ncbi:MAG: VCBS repeat-containing protein [Myxococcales bacterium]|nr:VCBS repeat-containing protein [Myxococcales bacterium]
MTRVWAALLAVGCGAAEERILAPEIRLVDETAELGLPLTASLCLVARDLDGDTFPDLVLGKAGALVIARNRSGAGFDLDEITLGDSGFVPGRCALGQLVGDARADLVVIEGGRDRSDWRLFEGTEGGGFVERPGLLPAHGQGLSAVAVVDLHHDGRAEIVVAQLLGGPRQGFGIAECRANDDDFYCALATSPTTLVRQYLWDGEGFHGMDVGHVEGIVQSIHVGDCNADHRPDLLYSVDFGHNVLHLNDGGSLKETLLDGDGMNHAMGIAFDDFDLDGTSELFVADAGPTRIHEMSGGDFESLRPQTAWAATQHVSDATRYHFAWAPVSADFDNDGDLDLLVPSAFEAQDYAELARYAATLGAPDPEFRAPNDMLLVNRTLEGDSGVFESRQVSHRSPSVISGALVSAALDVDQDGRQDVVIIADVPTRELRLLMNRTDTVGTGTSIRLLDAAGIELTWAHVLAFDQEGHYLGSRTIGTQGLGHDDLGFHIGVPAGVSLNHLEVSLPGHEEIRLDGPFTEPEYRLPLQQ